MPDTTPAPLSAYQTLEKRFRRIAVLGEAQGILHWDHATIMPSGGSQGRAEQLAELRAVEHGFLTAADMGELIDKASAEVEAGDGDTGREDWRRANLREMRRRWRAATALSEDLVGRLSRASSACEHAWQEARPAADFSRVREPLREVVAAVREAAAAKADVLGVSRYDALLDDYEPDGRSEEIDRVFGVLEARLPQLLGRVLERQAAEPAPSLPRGPFPAEKQRLLGVRLMKALGFDFEHGRLDVSLHPFCGGTPDDVRITTRYDEDDFTSAIMGVLHETGHGLYERGLPREWRLQPVGEAHGMSLHESQSLLVEMQVCRSREFLGFAAPIMQEVLGGSGPAWEPDNLYRLYTRVERSHIRVDADEVTYPLHVILRYRLEKAVIEGRLEVDDLPDAWNETFEKLVGIPVPDDRVGVLQDIHWYDGAWGYFPTYTLGAMTAAQLFDAAKQAEPEIVPAIARGDFRPLMIWLREHVHGKGRLLPPRELVTRATGKPLDPEIFLAHLERRYLG